MLIHDLFPEGQCIECDRPATEEDPILYWDVDYPGELLHLSCAQKFPHRVLRSENWEEAGLTEEELQRILRELFPPQY